MRKIRFLLLATTIAASVLALPGPAFGAPRAQHAASASGPPWQPYRTRPFTDRPGAVCSFGVRGQPVFQREQYRTLSRYRDGKPMLQEYRGPLYVRYINLSNRKSAVENLSGYGYFLLGRDGSLNALFIGHGGVSVPIGNKAFPAGEWVLSGRFTVRIEKDGQISITRYDAAAKNMCVALA